MSGESDIPLRLTWRVAALGLLTVLVQAALLAQVSVFGVSADITPLVVMSVGLLCGSLPGAITGFGIGLFVDLVLVQTLGLSSLLFIPIGYWAGRLRELRDPSHGLVPLAVGAAATLWAGIGMLVLQFLLGVSSPVSGLLFQQIFMGVLINTIIVLPVHHAVVRLLGGAVPTGPRGARAPVRRSYTTGALSPLQQPSGRFHGGARPRPRPAR